MASGTCFSLAVDGLPLPGRQSGEGWLQLPPATCRPHSWWAVAWDTHKMGLLGSASWWRLRSSSPCFAGVAERGEGTKWGWPFCKEGKGEKIEWVEGLVEALGLFLRLQLLQKLQERVVAGTGRVGVMGG